MRCARSKLVQALTAVAVATSIVVSGCATPPTPASLAADAAANAASPLTPPTSAATPDGQTIVAIQPSAPPPKQCTLCGFLGLDKAAACMGGLVRRAFSRIWTALGLEGRFPGLQAKPPLLPITDPANLGPDSPPAVKAAAEAKMEEDQAAQKVQALRYLATIGCGGCYPGIEEAMLAALDDCTEEVRYEALLALRGNDNVCCAYCRCYSCCSPAVRKKLSELANNRDENGCWEEPSERVRRLARVSLAACGGLVVTTDTVPTEGPTPAPPPGPANPLTLRRRSPDETLLMPPIQLVSFEEATDKPSPHDSVLARVNGEPVFESRIVPLVEEESSLRREQGYVVGPDQFQKLLAEQIHRAIDAKLLLQQAHRDLRAAGRPFGPLTTEEIDQWLKDALGVDPYISLLELNTYYRAHLSKFQAPTEVRWEQVTIWAKDYPSREKALAVAEAVCRRVGGSVESTANVDLRSVETRTIDYKPYDRVEPQSLVPALKTLPVGAVGPVVEHGDELFIVRVLDRRPGALVSFDEAAPVLRKQIIAERRRRAEESLLSKLRQGADVWTVFEARSAAIVPSPIPLPPGGAALAPLQTAELPKPLSPQEVVPAAMPPMRDATAPQAAPQVPPPSPFDPRRAAEQAKPQIIRFDFSNSSPAVADGGLNGPNGGAAVIPVAVAPVDEAPIPLPPVAEPPGYIYSAEPPRTSSPTPPSSLPPTLPPPPLPR